MINKNDKIKDVTSSPYNSDFVKKIKQAEENVKKGNFIVLTPEYKKKLFGK